MTKYQNHLQVLGAIEDIKAELPSLMNSPVAQSEAMDRLATLYSCLDIPQIKSLIRQLEGLDERHKDTVLREKKAA